MQNDDASTLVYLTSDFAREVKRAAATIRCAERDGRLRASFRSPRGVHVYTRADVEAYLAQRAQRQRGAAS